MPHHRSQKRRAILTELQAIEIFTFRYESSVSMMTSCSSVVAKRYGVDERTVRDIWKQRTWTHATRSLAECASPIAKRKMGRPVGSKDVRPRKQKLYAGSTPSIPIKCDATRPFWEYRPRSGNHFRPTGSGQEDKPTQKRRFNLLLLESSDEAAFLADRSPVEHEREQEASIDDQLHAWAHRGPQWIISAALPLHGDFPWDCAPSVC
jgi:hypothetical protein